MTVTEASPKLFIDSKPLLEAKDFKSLWKRVEKEGYLFFKQLLPREPVLELRKDILSVLDAFGWLAEGPNGEDNWIDKQAIDEVPYERMRYGIGISDQAYEAVNKLERFHRLPHHPNLLEMYRGLFADEVLVHARHIARITTPHKDVVPTPLHQDYPLIQGSRRFWTLWTPLGDCPREMGSLTVLHNSQDFDVIPIEKVKGAGEVRAQLCPGEDTWVEGDFEAGDVLTFPCTMVHKALPSEEPRRARLSLDLRYQPLSDVVEKRSLEPHAYNLSWEEIYENWEEDDLKYYWERLPIQLAPWDDRYLQPKKRIC